jgi:hypothetical protein
MRCCYEHVRSQVRIWVSFCLLWVYSFSYVLSTHSKPSVSTTCSLSTPFFRSQYFKLTRTYVPETGGFWQNLQWEKVVYEFKFCSIQTKIDWSISTSISTFWNLSCTFTEQYWLVALSTISEQYIMYYSGFPRRTDFRIEMKPREWRVSSKLMST